MAGKTRNRAVRTPSPRMKVDVPKGHLGLKSSPFAPIDSKLTNQFMVVDHMNAHYRKITKARAVIDTTPPKSMMGSQKVRDQVRRAALLSGTSRRETPSPKNHDTFRPRSCANSSEVARDEMVAMMESLDDYDEVDIATKPRRVGDSNITMKVHPSNSAPVDPGMALIDKIIADQKYSPSKYHTTKESLGNADRTQPAQSRSNSRSQNLDNTGKFGATATLRNQFGATATLRNQTTPRNADLLEQQAHKFTKEKPFQPRINRTNRTSKLSQFKYYNAPRKSQNRTRGMERTQEVDRTRGPKQGTRVLRASTPLTESADLMSATLMSRDFHQMPTPTGVPPLDISLDQDHMRWLKEQSKMAHLRATYRTEPEQSVAPAQPAHRNLASATVTGHINIGPEQLEEGSRRGSIASQERQAAEEELKYLGFISDVTNDVLDRGIFTNRVLRQVFLAHMERRKHDLKVSRMRELLDDLRRDLGIQEGENEADESIGLTSTFARPPEQAKTLSFGKLPGGSSDSGFGADMGGLSINDRKDVPSKGLNGTIGGSFDPLMMTTKKFDMATLRQASRSASQSRSRSPSPGAGRPPLSKRRSSERLLVKSRENSLEEDDAVQIGRSTTSLDENDDGHVGSKQDDDLGAYKLPPPASSSVFGTRQIMPIEEQSETTRTETARTETARTETGRTDSARSETARNESSRTDESQHDDTGDENEGEEATGGGSSTPTLPPKPAPRRRSTVTATVTEDIASPTRSTSYSSVRSSTLSSPKSTKSMLLKLGANSGIYDDDF